VPLFVALAVWPIVPAQGACHNRHRTNDAEAA
jgi:hypothetical protein